MKKKICVITGSRAEYGLFCPLLKLLKKCNLFSLQLIATGMHLSPEFGLTYRDIEKDEFRIDEKVNIRLNSDTPQGILTSMGLALDGLGKALSRLKPDLVVVLGDRFEIFCAATAAHVYRIPIAHLYGGELSAGAIDEAFRHSITKMSLLHFTSTEEYRRRVIQLGEDPKKVFNVGALGIDNIREMKLLTKAELEQSLDFSLGNKSVLVTFHPVTLEHDTAECQFGELSKAIDHFQGLKIIFTKPNADTEGRIIIKLIDNYVNKNSYKARAFTSLGQLKYLSTLKHVNVVVGNSSSGIVEAPSLKTPTVNIGDRQMGRIKAESIIDCNPERKEIIRALETAFSKDFQEYCKKIINPYGNGNTSVRIVKIIKEKIDDMNSLKKVFYDLKKSNNV